MVRSGHVDDAAARQTVLDLAQRSDRTRRCWSCAASPGRPGEVEDPVGQQHGDAHRHGIAVEGEIGRQRTLQPYGCVSGEGTRPTGRRSGSSACRMPSRISIRPPMVSGRRRNATMTAASCPESPMSSSDSDWPGCGASVTPNRAWLQRLAQVQRDGIARPQADDHHSLRLGDELRSRVEAAVLQPGQGLLQVGDLQLEVRREARRAVERHRHAAAAERTQVIAHLAEVVEAEVAEQPAHGRLGDTGQVGELGSAIDREIVEMGEQDVSGTSLLRGQVGILRSDALVDPHVDAPSHSRPIRLVTKR